MSEIIPHWLTKQAALSPQQTAIELVNGKTITFSELEQQSMSYARKLMTAGMKEGDHVAILAENGLEMIIAIHAISYVGACAVLLNTRLTAKEVQYQLDDANVSLLIFSDDCETIATSLKVMKSSFKEVEDLKEDNTRLKTEINLGQAFTIIYTSGTTGFPKGVVHTYGNHWWSAIGSALNLGLSKTDKWLAVLPFFHVGGLSIFIRSVIYGMPVYLMEKFNEQLVHDAIKNKGVTIASVVTVMLQRLLRHLGDDEFPEHFRCMLLGGGPVPKPLLEQAKTHRIPVFQSYGMTETSSQIVTLSPQDAMTKLGSAGKPLFPAQLRIQNANGQVGEIEVKGPMVTKGYWHHPEANEKNFESGWLKTGDLGYVDEEGFLYVVDRRNDLIISVVKISTHLKLKV
ncbi:o-succinylbenzoate--CoA ligase [Paracerasibacillus soli]|uniref:o-succinylbenzoate--CoA ligase n=1 Tax=Paracerasibacillus soli TaxID=480284 RepID=UPI00387E1A4E